MPARSSRWSRRCASLRECAKCPNGSTHQQTKDLDQSINKSVYKLRRVAKVGPPLNLLVKFDHAALMVFRNLLTSAFNRLLSEASVCAADRTCDDAVPVSLAPRCTSEMLADTC